MATDGQVNRWNGVAYAAADERLLDSVLLMPGPAAGVFASRGGRRVNGAGLAVSVGGSPEAWTVTAGAGVIADPTYASQGPWRFEIPTAKTAQMPPRPPSGQSRIDLIVARIYDSDISVGAVKEVKIERVDGAAGATPSAPAVPALSLVLATLTVPNAGAITVTQSTSRVVAAGGILPVATTTERDDLTAAGIAYRGMVVDNATTGRLERFNGTNWVALADAVTGQEWVDAVYASGYEPQGGRKAKSRLRGDTVRLDGFITRNSGSFPASAATTVATLADGHRPPDTKRFSVGASPTQASNVHITSAGLVQIVTSSSVPAYISLDGITFDRD